ncbi:hypothetical protein EHS25_004765 [Saitozyma podzolica]|uniref:Uncharacterized protein n=1 Tax=Saitozyma podzolica TaxID=1890683 RepID=A0A427Y2S2_9TREE|nr:hypothetical protein EHS25_004765 [Saitozyma podzolica]
MFDNFDTMAVVSGDRGRHLLDYASKTASDDPFCILLTIEAFGFGPLATGCQERSDICAASGIGKAAVTSYALAGARTIYATDLSESGLQEVAEGVMREHPKIKVVAVRMGIAMSEEMEALVRRVVNESRRLDWFFANAGIVDFESFNNTTEEQMTRLFTVNTVGVFNSIQWAARGMMNISNEKPRSGGSIVVTTSLASTFGGIGSPAYTTSKHATLGLLSVETTRSRARLAADSSQVMVASVASITACS